MTPEQMELVVVIARRAELLLKNTGMKHCDAVEMAVNSTDCKGLPRYFLYHKAIDVLESQNFQKGYHG